MSPTNDLRQELDTLMLLGQTDHALLEVRRRLQGEPKRLEAGGADLEKAKAALGEWQQRRQQCDQRQRHLERELRDEEARMARSDVRLKAVRTNEEYQAVLKEVEDAKKRNSLREDEILQLLETHEESQAQLSPLEREAEIAAAAHQQLTEQSAGEVKRCEELIVQLESYRQQLLAEVGQGELFRKYTTLQQRLPVPIVRITREFCDSCRMSLPPQLFNQVKAMVKPIQCPNCFALLYWHPEGTLPQLRRRCRAPQAECGEGENSAGLYRRGGARQPG